MSSMGTHLHGERRRARPSLADVRRVLSGHSTALLGRLVTAVAHRLRSGVGGLEGAHLHVTVPTDALVEIAISNLVRGRLLEFEGSLSNLMSWQGGAGGGRAQSVDRRGKLAN